MCACRPCYLRVRTRRAPAAGASGPCPIGTSRSPTSPSRDSQWDALQIPVGVAFFFMQLVARSRRCVLSEPGWSHRVAAAARLVGRDRCGQPGSGDAAARRRSVPGAQRRPSIGAERRPSATSCRSTSATSSSANCAGCGRASTGAPRPTPHSTRSSIACAAGSAGTATNVRAAPMSPVSFEVVGARVEAYAAVPTMVLRLRISRRR